MRMKKIIPILIIIVVLSSCKKDNEVVSPIQIAPPDSLPTLYTTYGGLHLNQNSTIFLNDSNLIIAGYSNKNTLVIKLAKSGEEIWRNEFYAGYSSNVFSIVQSSTNELFAYGSTRRNYTNNETDLLLVKMNSQGDTIWTKTYGGTETDYGRDIIITSDDNLLIVGMTISFGASENGNIYLVKLNFDGDTLWTHHFLNQDLKAPSSLIETLDGNYLITGYNNTQKGLCFLKTNSNGEKLWDKNINAGLKKYGYSTIELSNGDLMTCGEYFYEYGSKVLVIKTDSQGDEIWEKVYGGNNKSVFGNSIRQNIDGTFTIIGSAFNINPINRDIILFKIDQNGNEEWFKKFGSSETDRGVSLLKDIDDNNIITGIYNGSIFMTKIDNEGKYK